MHLLYDTPGPLDLEGWKAHARWLRTEAPEFVGRDEAIEHADMMIALIYQPPEKTASGAR